MNISGESWLRAAHTTSGRTTSFGADGNTSITIGTGGGRIYRSGTATAGAGTFNVYGTIHVNGGLLQTDAERNGDIRIRNDLHLNNGNSLAVNAGTLQLITAGSTTSLSFANNGDTASRFYGTAANSRLLFYSDLNIDVSGFDWDQTAERSWELFDWDSFGGASGFLQADGVVKTGDTEWTASGDARYYNEAGGKVWTYSNGGLDWTFTESTGVLSVQQTDPENPVITNLDIALENGDVVATVAFDADENRTYSLQFTTNLLFSAEWHDVVTNATSSPLIYTNNSPQGFFRVKAQ